LALLATTGVAAGGVGVASGGVVLGALAGGGVLESVAGDGADDVPLPSEPPHALSRKAIPSACSQRTVTGILLKCVM
jgi:hypothetical protein